MSMNLYQRLSAVAKECGGVGKTGKAAATMGGYAFHKIDDVIDHIRAKMLEHGVLFYPVDLTHEDTHCEGPNGKTTYCSIATFKVRFVNCDNPDEYLDAETYGYGLDNQDKGPGKCISYGLKTVLLNLLQLRGQPDNEQDEIERPSPAVQRARQAAQQHGLKTGDQIPAPVNGTATKHPNTDKLHELCNRLDNCTSLKELAEIRAEVEKQPKGIKTAPELRRHGAAAKVRCLLCSPQNSEGYAKELAEAVKHADDKTVENFAMWWASEGTRGLFTEPALSILSDAAMASVG